MKLKINKKYKFIIILSLSLTLLVISIVIYNSHLFDLIKKPSRKYTTKKTKFNNVQPKKYLKILSKFHSLKEAQANMRMHYISESAELQTNNNKDFSPLLYDDSWLPEKIQPVFDFNKTLSFKQKLQNVHNLHQNLSAKERLALYYFIKTSKDNDEGLVLKNDIMNALRSQKIYMPEYTEIMINFFNDENLDITNRMYILQHFRPWYEKYPQDREKLRHVFYKALDESHTGVAGTAILALHDLQSNFNEFDQNKIINSAINIAKNESNSILSRISAIKVCGKMHAIEIQPILRSLIQENISTSLSLSAISAIGDIGTFQDIDLLNNIIKNGDKRYYIAAITAKKRLKSNLNISYTTN